MTAICYTPFKIPKIRVTKLNGCGQPVTGCSTVVTDGIVSIAMTKEMEDREEFFQKNGDGAFCVTETNAPILKWINLVLTFCDVDPELVNIIAGEPTVTDDAAAPNATGYRTEEDSPSRVNFALEGWTRISNLSTGACTGGPEYGYVLFPWVIEGSIGDITHENGLVSFTLTGARTRNQSPWGTGPYFVDYSDNPAGSTTNIALLTPVGSREHHRMFLTRKPPPDATCGCTVLSSLTPA